MDQKQNDTIQPDTSSQIDQKLQEELQSQLEKYQQDNSVFISYIETIKKIDTWLESGEHR